MPSAGDIDLRWFVDQPGLDSLILNKGLPVLSVKVSAAVLVAFGGDLAETGFSAQKNDASLGFGRNEA